MTRSASAKFARCKNGASAVEFALIAPPLFGSILGVLALAFAYYQGATMQWSIERSVRVAMLNPDVTVDDIRALIADDLASIGAPDVNLSYEIDNAGAVPLAIVRASYETPLNLPLLSDLALPFTVETVTPLPPQSNG